MVQNSKKMSIWKKKLGKDRVLIQGQIKAGFILARGKSSPESIPSACHET
jgi:hypothetical protein